ncbi:MAG: hypothetical protein ACR2MN_13990 [Acidimicrobiales bacterium]
MPLTPTRIADTRTGAHLGPTGTLTVSLPSSVRASAIAATLSVTAVDVKAPGFLSVYPTGQTPASPTSVLSYRPGLAVPNLVISEIGANSVTVASGSTATVYVVVDLEGYFDRPAPPPPVPATTAR